MWKLGNGVGESEALVTIIQVANHGRASGACRSWPFHRVWDREGGWGVQILFWRWMETCFFSITNGEDVVGEVSVSIYDLI